jgi:hypothetical protein
MGPGFMNQVRYVDLGLVSKEIHTGIWEYQHIIDIQEPTILQWSLEKESAVFFGIWPTDLTHIFEHFEDKIRLWDAGVLVSEHWKRRKNKNAAFYLEGPLISNTIFFSKFDSEDTFELCRNSVSDECSKYNIEIKKNIRNDLLFNVDGKWKKFFGAGRVSVFDWNEVTFSTSYKVHVDLGNKIRKWDTKKVLKAVYLYEAHELLLMSAEPEVIKHIEKFDGDLSNVIGGLWEVNPNIEQQKFNFDVIKDFTDKLNLEIRKDTLSNSEWDLLMERGSTRLSDEDWILKGIDKNFV